MSQPSNRKSTSRADAGSRHAGTASTAILFDFTTDHVAEAERFEFLYATTGQRMECAPAGNDKPLSVQVRGLVSAEAEFLDYKAQAITMDRTPALCEDGRDEISIGLVIGSMTGAAQNGREMKLARGELYVIDFARPVRSLVPDHHEVAVALPRKDVVALLDTDVSRIGGRRLANRGIGGLLASHMRAVAAEASRLSPSERDLALRMMKSLALAALQAEIHNAMQAEMPADTLYDTARALIDRDCSDPELTPDRVAVLLGCSRATLYRVFGQRDEKVAGAIWAARLDRAYQAVSSADQYHVPLAEIAFRCGFLDQSTFNRMFKTRFGLTPRDAREAGLRSRL